MNTVSTAVVRYTLAVPAVLGVGLVRFALTPLLGSTGPFLLLVLAPLIVSWVAGFGPGLFAAVLATVAADQWFLEPSFSSNDPATARGVALASFLVEGLLVSWLAGTAHRGISELASRLSEPPSDTVANPTPGMLEKNEILATLAHELRDPLAPLLNSAEFLQMTATPGSPTATAAVVIGRQARSLARIVDDLLDVFGIKNGKVVLRRTRLDLGSVVREVAAKEREPLETHGVRLDIDVPSSPVCTEVDRGRFEQVLSNLLQNARKFTHAGDVVTVQLRAEAGSARLTVRDTGEGIPADLLPCVFDLFTQAPQDLDRARGGCGLGLALVKGLIELHGGTVTAHSAGPGQGAEFEVVLPLAEEPVGNGEPIRVLIADDSPTTALTTQLLLKRYGFQTEAALTGLDAVRRAGEWKPDIVLCDLGLPDLDGFKVARALAGGPHLVALTGRDEPSDRKQAAEAGFAGFLVKPVEPAALVRMLWDLAGAKPTG